jgi:hypothetical protein
MVRRKTARGKRVTPRINGKSMTPEEFVLLAIEKLRPEPGKGIHAVFSGFNEAFRLQFPGQDPVVEMQQLEEKGVITIYPCKGGVIINTPGVRLRGRGQNRAKQVLVKMGLE